MFLIPDALMEALAPGVAGPLLLLLPMTMSTDCEWDFHLPRRFLVRFPSFDIDAACFHWSKNFLDLAVVAVVGVVEARDRRSADWPLCLQPPPPDLLLLSVSSNASPFSASSRITDVASLSLLPAPATWQLEDWNCCCCCCCCCCDVLLLCCFLPLDDCCFDFDFFGFAPADDDVDADAAVASEVGEALQAASSEEFRCQGKKWCVREASRSPEVREGKLRIK